MSNDFETLRQALRQMPVPEPRAGFVERVLANAVAAAPRKVAPAGRLRHFATRWETWVGAAFGGAVAAAVALILLRPVADHSPAPGIALTLHEARDIDVLINSERDLEGATIRILATGSVALNGFGNEHEIGWQTHLERGSNLLSLPIVARSAGDGRLVAVIEHEGRSRRVTVSLTVRDSEDVSQS